MAFATRLEKQDLEKLVSPKIKLFLSVDVVGSTAFKQAQPNTQRRRLRTSGGPSNWLTFLSSFYRDFGNRIRLHLGRRLKVAGIAENFDPDEKIGTTHLWKALGDELIFVIELRHENHIPIILDAFRHAINEEIDHAKAGEHPLPISLKGTAWVAGFPVCNAEIPMIADVPEGTKNGSVIGYDYAGPSIDIGFRIAKLASPQRLIVSAEIAYLLTVAGGGGEIVHHLHLDHPTEFKGVLGGEEYPVFWIDCFRDVDRESWLQAIDNKSYTAEQERYYRDHEALYEEGRSTLNKRDGIRRFLESWFDRHREILIKPFVPNDTGLCPKTQEYDHQLDLVQAELRDLYRGDEDRDDGDPKADYELNKKSQDP